MALAAHDASETVRLQHHFKAAPQQVFDAWSSQHAMAQWFGPQSHRCRIEHYDFRVGGAYRIRMIPTADDADCAGDAGKDSVCAGEFVEIDAPRRIVMTFSWVENGADVGETILSVEFYASGDGTDLVLVHERLPSDGLRNAHRGGWESTLASLQAHLSQTSG